MITIVIRFLYAIRRYLIMVIVGGSATGTEVYESLLHGHTVFLNFVISEDTGSAESTN